MSGGSHPSSSSSSSSWRGSRTFAALPPFTRAVLELCAAVPRGRVATYGLIGAALIGLSLWWSVRHKRRFPDAEIEDALRAE